MIAIRKMRVLFAGMLLFSQADKTGQNQCNLLVAVSLESRNKCNKVEKSAKVRQADFSLSYRTSHLRQQYVTEMVICD